MSPNRASERAVKKLAPIFGRYYVSLNSHCSESPNVPQLLSAKPTSLAKNSLFNRSVLGGGTIVHFGQMPDYNSHFYPLQYSFLFRELLMVATPSLFC